LVVTDLEGFSPEKDLFGRADLALGLSNLLGSIADPVVLAIDAPWGSGKTAFLKMWAGELRKSNFPVVYFDAFENDFADDAFTAIASQIIGLVEERTKGKRAKSEFLKTATATGKILLRSSLRLGVKIATLNALDTKEFEDAASATADELSGLTDKYVGERLTKHNEQVATFDQFRTALSALPGLIAPGDKPLPLVVMIDELDRCRPVYALELLERIKHFFSVPNVHFVLGVNLTQLENSVSSAYGATIDAKTYLHKFIQIVCSLSDTGEHSNERVTTKYVQYLRKVLQFKNEDRETVQYASAALVQIAEKKRLSLRSIERAMSNLALACAFTTPNTLRPAPLVAGLAVIKALDPSLYRRAKEGILSYDEAANFLGLENTSDIEAASFDERWWRFCLDPTVPETFKQQMMSGLGRYHIWEGPERILPMIANHVMDRLKQN
jgi:hypothetical protein